jgi:anti-anti-sigma factor
MLLSQLSRQSDIPAANPDIPERPPTSVAARGTLRPAPLAPTLEVIVHQSANDLVVRVKGEATIHCAGALLDGLLTATAQRPDLVTLDLTQLRFISSTAMGVLVTFRRGVIRWGGQLSIAPNMHPAVREALARAELLELFEKGGITAAA